MNQLDNNEREILRSISQAIASNKNKPIQLRIQNEYFSDITGARKYTGVQHGDNEVYTDFVLERRSARGYNVALKSAVMNESIERLDIIVPNLKTRFMKSVYKKLTEMNLEKDQNVPNMFGKIDERNKKKLVTGTYSVGGPIDFMYVELPKTIRSDFDKDSGLLVMPGKLVAMDEYAKSFDLYLNLRPAYSDQKYDPDMQRGGIKMIYGKSQTKGISDIEIVVTNSVSENGILVNIE